MAYRALSPDRSRPPVVLTPLLLSLGIPFLRFLGALALICLGIGFAVLSSMKLASIQNMIASIAVLIAGVLTFIFALRSTLRSTTSLQMTLHPAENVLVVVHSRFGRPFKEVCLDLKGITGVILEESSTNYTVGGYNYGRLPRWRLGLEHEDGDFAFKPITDDFYRRRSPQERARKELIHHLWSEAQGDKKL